MALDTTEERGRAIGGGREGEYEPTPSARGRRKEGMQRRKYCTNLVPRAGNQRD